MTAAITIRQLIAADYPLLEHFTYLAIHLPEGVQPPPKEIVRTEPELRLYWDGFGLSDGDLGFAAEADGEVVGLAWARNFPIDQSSYGTIDAETPEIAVAVEPEWRNQGVGTQLLQQLRRGLKTAGFDRVSLSVQKTNPALRLYSRQGFTTVTDHGDELLMVKSLS
ncbi:MAG: GNAT family N-acetyltransferase [Propionibacteriaceae bacterium]|jgi:ribosomal protein S18 acetylase RimI-like enzyme|nr:GNAT family N-acetyltransferase [Propionibacteriaceae bacterium]